MAVKKIEIRPKGTGDYADILYPKTSADMVIANDGQTVETKLANISSTASGTSVTDTGNYYTSTNVEGSLQEIGQTLNSMRGSLVTSTNSILGS